VLPIASGRPYRNIVTDLIGGAMRRAWRVFQQELNPERWQFYRLRSKLGAMSRYQIAEVDAAGYRIRFVDPSTFLSMYYLIFVSEGYRFHAASRSPLILDCGANIGMSVLKFKSLYPDARIMAFEPDPSICATLRYNIQTNHLNQIDVIEAAVWTETGKIPFISDHADSGRIVHVQNQQTLPVNCVRLRDYLNQPVDLLKIDVEGAEASILLDCADRLSCVHAIILEYHSFAYQEQKLDQVLGVLRDQGFRCYIHSEQVRPNPFDLLQTYREIDQTLTIYAVPASVVRYSA
jgi:FkbM family methyltransferase